MPTAQNDTMKGSDTRPLKGKKTSRVSWRGDAHALPHRLMPTLATPLVLYTGHAAPAGRPAAPARLGPPPRPG